MESTKMIRAAENRANALIKRQTKKALRLLTSTKRWRNEKNMDDAKIEAYLEHMADNVEDDPKIMNCLLKWQELQKKYAKTANPFEVEYEPTPSTADSE